MKNRLFIWGLIQLALSGFFMLVAFVDLETTGNTFWNWVRLIFWCLIMLRALTNIDKATKIEN